MFYLSLHASCLPLRLLSSGLPSELTCKRWRRKSPFFFFAFVSDIELGSSKTLADAAAHQLLRLTSPFQRSAALLQLLRPCLVTTPPLTVADRVSGQSETVLHKHTASFFPQYGIKNAHCNQKVKAPCPPAPPPPPPRLHPEALRVRSSANQEVRSVAVPLPFCRQHGAKVEQSASLMQALHAGSRGALICSPTRTSGGILGSTSLDKDAAALPHGRLKGEAWGAAAAAAAAKRLRRVSQPLS